MGKVSQEELQKSLEYLEEFEKGQASMEVDETANGGQTEEIAQLKKESHIKSGTMYILKENRSQRNYRSHILNMIYLSVAILV